jgi:Na+/melibiose symporter-like transporter
VSVVSIPWYSILRHAAVSDERLAERTTLSAVRILLGSLGATIVAVATLPLVGAGERQSEHGFFYTAVIFGVLPPFSAGELPNVKENISITRERMTLNAPGSACAPIDRGSSSPSIFS